MKNSRLLPGVLIILTTTVVGLMNTVFIRPEDLGTWKNYVGYAFLLIAVMSIVALIIRLRKSGRRADLD